MKEEYAKKKWCPMVNFQIGPVNSSVWQGVAYTNRGQEYDPGQCLCIASDCMMWVEDKATNCMSGESYVCGGHCGLIK